MAAETEYLKLGMPKSTEAVLESLNVFNANAETIDAFAKNAQEAMDRLDAEKANKAYMVTFFEELKALIQSNDTEGVIALLDQAILDNSILA